MQLPVFLKWREKKYDFSYLLLCDTYFLFGCNQPLPVRIAYPNNINGLFEELKDPSFSTVVGLLLYKAGNHTPYEINFQQELLHSKSGYEEDIRDIKITNTVHTPEDKPAKKPGKEKINKTDI